MRFALILFVIILLSGIASADIFAHSFGDSTTDTGGSSNFLGTNRIIAVNYTAASTYSLSVAQIYVSSYSSFEPYVNIRIYPHNSTGKVNMSAQNGGNSTSVLISSTGYYNFTFSNAPLITSGTSYFVIISHNGTTANYFRIGDNAGTPNIVGSGTSPEALTFPFGASDFKNISVKFFRLTYPYYPYNTYTYDTQAFSQASATFAIRVIMNTSQNVYADLIYNGTNLGYTSRSEIDGNTTDITKTFTIPSTFGNSTGINYSFYWNITTINNQTTPLQQRVYTFNRGIDNCTNATQPLFNFTLYDESSRTISSASNIVTTMEARLISSTDGSTIAISNSSSNTTRFSLCTYPGWLSTNLTAKLYLAITYDGTNYFKESYNLHNFIVSNTTIPQSVDLYMTNDTDTNNKVFRINLKDASLINIENAIVNIYKYVPGTSTLILAEAPVTDTLGNAITHLELSNTEYKIIITSDGVTLDTKNKIKAYETTTCNSVYSECFLNLQLPVASSAIGTFDSYRGIYYNYSYARSSRIATFTFSASDSTAKNVTMNITKYQIPPTQLCATSTQAVANTITCTIPSNYNGTAMITVKVNGYILFTSPVRVISLSSLGDITEFKWFFIGLLIPLFVIMGYASISLSVILMMLGVVLLIGTGFIDSSWTGGGSIAIWIFLCLAFIALRAYIGGQKNG